MGMRPALYVHIPFCTAKCDYCDFFSVGGAASVPDGYVRALLAEARFHAVRLGVSSWRTVYLGGGTPSLLSAGQLSALLQGLRAVLPGGSAAPVEVTVEMNPESLTEGKLRAAQDAGATRLSLGVQSLCGGALRAVRRRCTARQALGALELARECWRGEVSVDAIAGLPGQDDAEFLASLRALASCGAAHVSLYALTVEEGTPLALRRSAGGLRMGAVPWSEDAADAQWLSGRDVLRGAGFVQYEVSNFALPGHEGRHNASYWEQADYVGVGAGATGTVYGFGGADSLGMRWTNAQDIDGYTEYWLSRDGDAPVASGAPLPDGMPCTVETLGLATEEFEFLMLGLRTARGVSAAEYRRRYHGLAWQGDLARRLGESRMWPDFAARGWGVLGAQEDGHVRAALTPDGLLHLNALLCDLA